MTTLPTIFENVSMHSLTPAGLLVAAALVSAAPVRAGVFPGASWDTRTPAELGMDVAVLDSLASFVGGSGMIVKDGYHVYTWGSETTSGNWASASKAVMSTLLFFADDEGLCSIDQAIGDFLSGGSVKDSSITFRDLANMVSGYSRAEWPGAAWAYNDYAINLYNYVLSYEVYGLPPQGAFNQKLGFLQLQDPYTIDGSTQFGRIYAMSLRDFARIGLFWLNRGNWNGVQHLPSSYFDTHVTSQVPPSLPRTTADGAASWNFGSNGGGDDQFRPLQGHYGFNFYVNTNGWWPLHPPNVFQANGHDGKEVCTVIPDLDLVAVGIGGNWKNPSTQAITFLYNAQVATGADASVQSASWGATKARYAP